MANKFYLYFPDAGSNPESAKPGDFKTHIISCDENVMALYEDVVKQYLAGSIASANAPTAYDTVADAKNADGDAIESGIQPRGLNLSIPGFGSAFLPVCSNRGSIVSSHLNGNSWNATMSHYGLGGATPLPADAATEGNLGVKITSARGESRSAN